MPQNVAYVAYGGSVASLGVCLDQVRSWLERYIVVIKDQDLDILALWIVHTWVAEETYTSPRLLIDSPVPGSGKTTLLEHLGKLCQNPIQMASVSSPALLARITANGIRTLLIDEADRSLDPKRPGVGDLVAILNSGYKTGGTRPVLVKGKADAWEVEEMPTYSPVAIAGNTPLLPDDTRSRCIAIRLMPDNEGKAEQSDWEWIEISALDLRDHIQGVADQVREQVRTARPTLPDNCRNRNRERWNPLAKIASVAGEPWVTKCNQAIQADLDLALEVAENGEGSVSPAVQIAQDLYNTLGTHPRFELSSELVKQLIRQNPEAWSYASPYGKDLTPKRLGSILNRSFGIYSQRQGANARGWHTNQFAQIWQKLGITPGNPTKATEATKATSEGGLL
jgi:hypothetical protein